MGDLGHLFRSAAEHAADYRTSLSERQVGIPVDRWR